MMFTQNCNDSDNNNDNYDSCVIKNDNNKNSTFIMIIMVKPRNFVM